MHYCIQNDTAVKIEKATTPFEEFVTSVGFHYLVSGFDSKEFVQLELKY